MRSTRPLRTRHALQRRRPASRRTGALAHACVSFAHARRESNPQRQETAMDRSSSNFTFALAVSALAVSVIGVPASARALTQAAGDGAQSGVAQRDVMLVLPRGVAGPMT